MHNQGTPRYDGPRALAQSLTAFAYSSATGAIWNREGLREDSEYRDLGLAAVTNGRIGVKHISTPRSSIAAQYGPAMEAKGRTGGAEAHSSALTESSFVAWLCRRLASRGSHSKGETRCEKS